MASSNLNRQARDVRRAVGLAIALVLVASGRGFAQRVESVVKVRMALATDAVHAGTTARAVAVAQIAPGFHINDHQPSLSYLIPTQIQFEPQRAFDVERIVYPRGKIERFAFSNTGLSVYQGALTMDIFLRVKAGINPGEYALRGKLEYQACNDHACLPPANAALLLKIPVVKPGVHLRSANSNVFANPAPK